MVIIFQPVLKVVYHAVTINNELGLYQKVFTIAKFYTSLFF
jgi:hypothetical protein